MIVNKCMCRKIEFVPLPFAHFPVRPSTLCSLPGSLAAQAFGEFERPGHFRFGKVVCVSTNLVARGYPCRVHLTFRVIVQLGIHTHTIRGNILLSPGQTYQAGTLHTEGRYLTVLFCYLGGEWYNGGRVNEERSFDSLFCTQQVFPGFLFRKCTTYSATV